MAHPMRFNVEGNRTDPGSKSQQFDDRTSRLKGDSRLFENGATGQLNPTWVEWLMGYPEGWTDLED